MNELVEATKGDLLEFILNLIVYVSIGVGIGTIIGVVIGFIVIRRIKRDKLNR